jgi:hypothetical protein
LYFSLLSVLMVAACAPAAATQAPAEITEEPTSTPEIEQATPEPQSIGPAETAVINQLARNLGLQEEDVTILRSEEVEFSDACLGVAIEGMLCAQVITPGREIVLEAEGIQYAYHTSLDGSRIQPATPALFWKREGGIAGFCDTLTVFRSGEVFSSKCNSQAEGMMGSFATLLSAQERKQFTEWMAELGVAELDASDPAGVADRMMVTLSITGAGDEPPTEAQQQELFEFAQELYQKLAQ